VKLHYSVHSVTCWATYHVIYGLTRSVEIYGLTRSVENFSDYSHIDTLTRMEVTSIVHREFEAYKKEL